MERRLDITITDCRDCPYLEHDSDYGISFDAGHDCMNGLIKNSPHGYTHDIDEHTMTKFRKLKGEGKDVIDPFIELFENYCSLPKI